MSDEIVLTAGAQKELKEKGYTTACGGVLNNEYLLNVIINSSSTYFRKHEPCGEFMESLERTKEQIQDNAEAIRKAGFKLVDTAKEANKQMAEVSGKFRDCADKMNSAIEKMTKIAGNRDFAETVALTASFVESMERLAKLEEKGLLEKVIKSMSKNV